MKNNKSFMDKSLGFFLGVVSFVVISGGLVHAITNEFSDHVNILDDKALQLGTDTDIQILYDEVTDNRMEITDGTNLLLHLTDAGTTGNLVVTGTGTINGAGNTIGLHTFGTAASVKGTLTVEREAALNGWMKWESSNGTDVYLFPDNAGNLRTHTVAPTADGDGTQLATGTLNDVIDDVTPQLGGNLDVNSFSIVSVSAGDVAITPDTTGDIVLDGQKWPQADGTSTQILTTDGAGQLSWTAAAGSAAISNVVEDTTPQLGGGLDVNAQEITGAIDLHSSGDLVVELGDAAGVNEVIIRDSSAVEVAIINSDGDAGFGTSSPAQKVHIFENIPGSVRLRLENNEGFGDVVADSGFLALHAGDGNIKYRAETASNRFYVQIAPDTTNVRDIGTVGLYWRNQYIRNIFASTQVEVGDTGTTRGIVSAWNGASTTPGTLELESSNGTIYRYFAQNDGTLRFHTVLPTSDSDGTAVDGGTTELSSDTTPQLGGNLDVNSNSIVSASAGNIVITPDTSGSIVLDGVNWPQADGATNTTLTTNGAGQTSWTNLAAGIASVAADLSPQLGASLDVNSFSVVSASGGNISITPDTSGDVILDGLKWPQADGSVDEVLTTNGSAQLAWATLKPTQSFVIAASDETTVLAAGTAVVTIRMPYAFTLTGVRASLNVAGDDATLVTIDINETGTTILSTKLTFDNGEKTTTTAATAPVISDTSLADDAEITIDIDQVDAATIVAAGLKVTLIGKRT